VPLGVSVPDFIKVSAYVLVFTAGWRLIAGHLSDKPIGKAMASVYS
jgi:hypothetical protein